jgi:hypothetical protein
VLGKKTKTEEEKEEENLCTLQNLGGQAVDLEGNGNMIFIKTNRV